MLTIDQKIAQKEHELSLLKSQKSELKTEQKVVIGGMFLSLSKDNPAVAQMVLDNLRKHIISNDDVGRIKPLLDELQALANNPTRNKDFSIFNEFINKPGNSI